MNNSGLKMTFAAKVLPVDSEKHSKILSFASKNSNLLNLLPKNVNITENYGFQLFSAEAFLCNKLNLNSDGILPKEAIEVKNKFPLCFCDLNHSRKNVVGVIIDSYYTDAQTGEELTEDQVKDMTEPFAVSVTGIIWKAVNQSLADAVEASNDKNSEFYNQIFLSWELMFQEYNLILMKANQFDIKDGKIIKDKEEIKKLTNRLISMGGNGVTDDGFKIGRLPVGNDVCPIAVGLVENPAGQLSPIVVETNSNYQEDSQDTKADIDNITEIYNLIKQKVLDELKNKEIIQDSISTICPANLQDLELMIDKNNISQSSNTTVIENNDNLFKNMKIEKIEQLTDENLKECKASVIQELFASNSKVILEEGIKKISEDYTKQLSEKENAIKAANEINEKSQNILAETEKKMKELEENYNKLIQANEQKRKLEDFSLRMESIENTFDLDEKQKEIVANKVKTLNSQDEFNTYLAEIEVLLAAKKKMPKKDGEKPGDKKNDKGPDDDADDIQKKKEAKASLEQQSIDDALKNGKADDKNLIPNGGSQAESLLEKSKRVFGFDGWQVVDKRKNRI